MSTVESTLISPALFYWPEVILSENPTTSEGWTRYSGSDAEFAGVRSVVPSIAHLPYLITIPEVATGEPSQQLFRSGLKPNRLLRNSRVTSLVRRGSSGKAERIALKKAVAKTRSAELPQSWAERFAIVLTAFQEKTSAASDAPNEGVDAGALLVELAEASSSTCDEVFDLIVRKCRSQDILDSSLRLYAQTANEVYLEQAASLLKTVGVKAWPALKRLAKSNREECELFVGLIAEFDGISPDEKRLAIRSLSRNPERLVRLRVLENTSALDAEFEAEVLGVLSGDSDSEIRCEAESRLAEIE